ncbi:hypothetical protein V6N11_055303 [Hibiscus sabdariffa]|uniref:Uncharacterized protein n=2 Tax=Hibiscus sabdariffa TaxID=183260 RepID=A0ABR2PFF1_9ROSI
MKIRYKALACGDKVDPSISIVPSTSVIPEDLESILDREAKVPICKVEEPLEVQEVGDSSRVDGRLSDASMEGTVVPNIASLDVDPANHLDRTSEGNMREDWRVLEVSSLSKNWSNEEEAGIVNRLDDSHLGADGLKEVFVPVNEVLEGIGEIASLGVLFAKGEEFVAVEDVSVVVEYTWIRFNVEEEGDSAFVATT